MNKGKICVSVCAETASEFVENIRRAAELADVIELRFDCLNKNEINSVLSELDTNGNYIFTYRSKEQGGKQELSLQERLDFWNSGNDFCGGDFEEDVVETSYYCLYSPVICSFHEFQGVPKNLNQIYERLKKTNVDVIKVAVQTDDITDTITLWKLLEKAKSEIDKLDFGWKVKMLNFLSGNKLNLSDAEPKSTQQIIPIAMGEAGKWTRILGLAHGAFMTYAALDEGSEIAPGQISARDLIETYRVKELNEQTEVYGIIGGNTSYSMSPYIHNEAFKFHGLNSVFVPLQAENLDEFMRRMVKPETREIDLNFRGFSVTIPHKQSIIKYVDSVDETAFKIGAVNTVKILDGKLYGYNTDAPGFIEPLKSAYGDLKNAKIALIGAGGAARACVYALKKEGAIVTIFVRDLEKAKIFAEEFTVEFKELNQDSNFAAYDVLVNTTPLGMKGKAEGETPAVAEQLQGLKLVYDLVYTPFETQLMKESDKAAVPKISGLAMLIAQATEQQKIWTGLDAPVKEMSRAVMRKLK